MRESKSWHVTLTGKLFEDFVYAFHPKLKLFYLFFSTMRHFAIAFK